MFLRAHAGRFEQELRTVGTLSRHPRCVTIYDSGFTADDAPYLVMEDMSGGSLRDRLGDGPLATAEAVDIGVKLAGVLEAAHDAGVLHRDIKPENVLLSEYGEPKLADFGIARLELIDKRALSESGNELFWWPRKAAGSLGTSC